MQFSAALDTCRIIGARLLRADIQGIKRLNKVNRLFHPNKIVWNFSNMDSLANTLPLFQSASPARLPKALKAIPDTFKLSKGTQNLSDFVTDRNVTSQIILKNGQIIHEAYYLDTKSEHVHISWSMSKSVTSILLGILIDKGIISKEALGFQIAEHVPSLRGTGYDGATLQNALNMASGVAFNEDYTDYHSDINRMGRVLGVGGSLDEFASTLGHEWKPDQYRHYVSVDTHVIGMMIRALTGQQMTDLLRDHLFDPLGLEHDGFILTDSHGEPFILGGLNLSSRDYARIALMVANGGEIDGRRIVSSAWIDETLSPSPLKPDPETAEKPDGLLGYGMHWWIPPDAEDGEFFGIGIYGQYMYVHRAQNIVIVQTAADTKFRDGDGIVNIESLNLFRAMAHAL